MGAVGSVDSGEAAEELLLVVVGLISETANDLLNTVHVLGHGVSGEVWLRLRVLAVSLLAVAVSVSQNDLEHLLGLVADLVLLGVLGLGDSLGALHGGGGGALGGVVEASDVQGVARPLVSVELFEESIVFSGEAPNNAVGSLHSATLLLLTAKSTPKRELLI